MNYTSRYGLEFNPFIKNSKDVLVETNDYKELIFRLNYLVQTKGFGVLTGGPGRGKTTMIRHWVKSLNQSAYKAVSYTHLISTYLNISLKFQKIGNTFNRR